MSCQSKYRISREELCDLYINQKLSISIWFILLTLCAPWVSKYQYGPVEWIWRMLTHMKLIPLLRQKK